MINRKFTTLLLSATMCAGVAFAQSTFPSAGAASQSLADAVKKNDAQAITKILGGSTDLASSQDEARDKVERQTFAEKYQQMNRLWRNPDGSMTLYIGAENWPFPVPIVQKNSSWRFDPDAGAKEVLYRRIGRNEIDAIELCHEFVTAKKKEAPPADALDPSLANMLATKSAGSDPILAHGYYFRVLPTGQGDHFALVAYPANYRSCGVMTFVVTEKNVVYQKDLGAESSSTASAMKTFKKDASWQNVQGGK